MKKSHKKQQNAHRTPSSKAMRMMNIYQIQAMEKFNKKPEYTALVSSEPWTGAVTGLTVTLRTPHTLWGGELPTAVLGMHLLRKWIFPGNSSFAEQHRTHQVLGVLLCVSCQDPEGPARLMGFLLTALWSQAAHRHHRGSREVYLTMENRECRQTHKVQQEKGRDLYSKEYNLKRV